MTPKYSPGDHPRERLISAATALFHDLGYHCVGVQTLCEEAGVAKGSFYHFFESKEELTIAAVDGAWERFKELVILPALDAETSPEERVRRIREACVDSDGHPRQKGELPHSCLFGRLAAGLTDAEAMVRSRIGEIFAEWAGLLATAGECDIDQGWAVLAEIQGRLVLGFTTHRAGVAGS
ncbi:MAG: hypothetical protein A2Z12_04685 [Actinobacteria bacterium RBG_16_68_21]|nr:MAG: hypothetical protein A2Z12_04685 [Actinobacteria bacterium RBG_16_68_21]